MPNPLWVDARDYLTNKGVPVTTGSLNSAMGFLAQNLNARPSYAKASPDAATSIGAGLGCPLTTSPRPSMIPHSRTQLSTSPTLWVAVPRCVVVRLLLRPLPLRPKASRPRPSLAQ
jgi:hypothetical protein